MQPDNYELMAHDHGEEPVRELETVGLPAKKPRLRTLDVAVLLLSISFGAIAITILRIKYLAWCLGYQNQLVVIGFALSIMSACLGYWRTYFLTLLEARFGRSTLQNYDAILQNNMYGPQTDFFWRLALLGFWILPIGLSVAYKLFTIGHVSANVQYFDTVDFGFYPPVGLEKVGRGIALMANLSLPFMQGTTAPDNYNADPLYPVQPGPYGMNTLLVSPTAAAALDLPNPKFVADVQSRLQQGETWMITANVLATVTRQNTTVDQYRDPEDERSVQFWAQYHSEINMLASVGLFNGYTIWMANNQKGHDQTWLFLAIQEAGTETPDALVFHSITDMFATWRERCTGTWNITRTTMRLVEGSCNGTAEELDPSYQKVFTMNVLGLDSYFLPTLSEFLASFSIERNTSDWRIPTMTATIASMMYSRVTSLNPPEFSNEELPYRNYSTQGEMSITSTRLGLRESKGLLLVILAQSTLLVVCMIVTWVLYAVPVDRTLGLVSILAGVDRSSLQRLSGASLSSKLSKKIRLSITVYSPDRKQAEIRYVVGGPEKRSQVPVKGGAVYG